jgi:hypothetical protein
VASVVEPSREQLELCARFSVTPDVPDNDSKLGVAFNVRNGEAWPLNGLRHPPAQDTNGWYIWAGAELDEAEDFFQPLHVLHVAEWRPQALPYLALPVGWRFLLAPSHEDVWFDPSLLNV